MAYIDGRFSSLQERFSNKGPTKCKPRSSWPCSSTTRTTRKDGSSCRRTWTWSKRRTPSNCPNWVSVFVWYSRVLLVDGTRRWRVYGNGGGHDDFWTRGGGNSRCLFRGPMSWRFTRAVFRIERIELISREAVPKRINFEIQILRRSNLLRRHLQSLRPRSSIFGVLKLPPVQSSLPRPFHPTVDTLRLPAQIKKI